MKESAVSATSRHPWSMTRECPRPGNAWNSVTAVLCCCNLYSALTTAKGTVWSCSPAMSKRGPRAGFRVLTRSSVHGLRLAAAPWKTSVPDREGSAIVNQIDDSRPPLDEQQPLRDAVRSAAGHRKDRSRAKRLLLQM